MALRHELDLHERNVEQHRRNVANVELQKEQALTRAQTQLAVLATQESMRGEPIDVTQRKGFDPDSPEGVLNLDELNNFEGAKLVINALSQHIKASERLITQEEPYHTAPGIV